MRPPTCSPPCAAWTNSPSGASGGGGASSGMRRAPSPSRESRRSRQARGPRGAGFAGRAVCMLGARPVGGAPGGHAGGGPDPARCGGLPSVECLVRGGYVRFDGGAGRDGRGAGPARVRPSRASMRALPPGDFSLALARAFLSAGMERFPGAGDGGLRGRPRSARPAADPQLLPRCSSMPISSWRKAPWKVPLDRRLMKGVGRLRQGRPMLLVDASADGSLVDRRIASLDGVFLYRRRSGHHHPRRPLGASGHRCDARERLFSPMRFALLPCRWVKTPPAFSRGVPFPT